MSETTLDTYTCRGMEAALEKALRDAATLGSGFVMISHGADGGLSADHLRWDSVRIDPDKLNAETR